MQVLDWEKHLKISEEGAQGASGSVRKWAGPGNKGTRGGEESRACEIHGQISKYYHRVQFTVKPFIRF